MGPVVRRRRPWLLAVIALVGGYLSLVASSAAGAPAPAGTAVAGRAEVAAGTGAASGPRTTRAPGPRGYRVPDEAEYARDKAAANARTAAPAEGSAAPEEEPL